MRHTVSLFIFKIFELTFSLYLYPIVKFNLLWIRANHSGSGVAVYKMKSCFRFSASIKIEENIEIPFSHKFIIIKNQVNG